MKFSIQTLIWSLVGLGVVVAGVMAFIPEPIEVETATAEIGDLRISVKEDGKTRIREKYVVSSPVAGRLSRIELDPGDEVCCDGSLIAVILPADPTMLDARSRAQAEARVEQAKSALKRSGTHSKQVQVRFELSQKKYDQARQLIGSNSISQQAYDVARTEYLADSEAIRTAKFDAEIAQFELKMAEAALLQFTEGADSNVKPFEVTSPIAGKVLKVFQESATVVAVGTPLIEIGDPQNLEIEIDVLSTDAVQIQPYANVTIDHWGGDSPLEGNVLTVEPAAFTKVSSLGVEEQRVNVIAEFNETPERIAALGDGYRVEAQITIKELEKVLLIPNSALFRNQREWHVFTLNHGTAHMQQVEIGPQNDSHTQILSGLDPGDEVVIYPSDQVRDGTKVRQLD